MLGVAAQEGKTKGRYTWGCSSPVKAPKALFRFKKFFILIL